MDRTYIAFISYRHEPLSISVAERLQSRIEHFRVPRALRKNGEKKPGYVFRDRTELPLSSDLSGDIYHALDQSEFLIVVCTPQTPKSLWVCREIEYFVSKKGHQRVLAVLASGTPEESFPAPLLAMREGDEMPIEPLAADIRAATARGSLRLLKGESLRLIAAILDCPYDALAQRERRYKRRVFGSLAAAAFAVAAAFIVMLALKNADITRMLLAAQRSETRVLTTESLRLLGEGDRVGAIRSAIAALPKTKGERPYDADAEYALARALYAYQPVAFEPAQNVSQSLYIMSLTFAGSGTRLVTTNVYGSIRCFDAVSARLLWEREIDYYAANRLFALDDMNAVLFTDGYGLWMLSAETGEILWTHDAWQMNGWPVLSDDGTVLAYASRKEVCFLSLSDGATLGRVGFDKTVSMGTGAFSPDKTVLVGSNEKMTDLFALDLTAGYADAKAIDISGAGAALYAGGRADGYGRLTITDAGDLYAVMDGAQARAMRYSMKTGATEWLMELPPYSGDQSVTLLHGVEQIAFAVGARALTLDAQSGETLSDQTLPGNVIAGFWTDEARGEARFVTDNGAVVAELNIKLYSAAGTYAEGCAVAAVPDGDSSRAVVLRDVGDGHGVTPAALAGLGDFELFSLSPSGEYLLCARDEQAIVLNTKTMEIVLERAIGRTALTFCAYIYDNMDFVIGNTLYPKDGEASVILPRAEGDVDTYGNCFARLGANGALLKVQANTDQNALRVWINGAAEKTYALPDEAISFFWEYFVGGNGYAMLRMTRGDSPDLTDFALLNTITGKWRFVRSGFRNTAFMQTPFCLGNTLPLVASLDEAGVLRLYDIESGKMRWESDLDLAKGAAYMISFCPGDGALLLTLSEGRFLFVSAADGSVITSYSVPDMSLLDAPSMCVTADGGYMFIGIDGHSGLYVDAETYRLRAVIPDMRCYLPLTDEVVLLGEHGDLAVYPRYSVDDLIGWGGELLPD